MTMSQRHNTARLKWLFLGKAGSKIYAYTLKTPTQQILTMKPRQSQMKLQDRATNLTDIITPRELVLHLKKRSQENKSHDQACLTRRNLQTYSYPNCYQIFKIQVKLKSFVENKFTKLLDFNITESKVIIRIWRFMSSIVWVTLNTHEVATGGFTPVIT
jgi:hypothetical protein